MYRNLTPPPQITHINNDVKAAFGYVYGLDGLRLLAVLIVIIRHFEISELVPGGFGVSIFFFISGFLITRLLLAEEHQFKRPIALGKFYIRRFIRLLPPLLLMGALSVPILYLLFPDEFSVIQVVLSFTYLGNIAKFGSMAWGWDEGYIALDPLWSLAVEEHFYLLLPPALLLFRGQTSRIVVVSTAIAGPLLLRIFVYSAMPLDLAAQFNYKFTFTRIDSIACGVLLTLLLDAGWLRLPAKRIYGHLLVLGGGILMLASIVPWNEAYDIAWKYSFQSAAIGVFFLGVIFAPNYAWLRRILERRPISHLGKISYELYLWHLPVFVVFATLLPNPTISTLLAFPATILISDFAYRMTTKRLSNLRRRFGAHPTQ